ncbi:MAG: hypothetical protein WKF55_03285 [Gemmatimonadaceae bacterium]
MNVIRTVSLRAAVLGSLFLAACSGPTEEDINRSLEDILASVNGEWTGSSTGANPVTLAFTLSQAGNGAVTGSGTMKETNAAASVPITIAGSYQRPALTLAFSGMVYEGKTVAGSFQGNYTTVGGVGSSLQLTAPGYSKALPVLLQEK